MDLLLILIYVAFCYVVFKVFKIPVNQWSLATAALGGIVGIAMLLLVMNYNHPFSTNARIYFTVTPVIPAVKGRVTEVPVLTDRPVKQGDVLFRIDARPYEYAVQQKRAALAEAEQAVGQLKAQLDQGLAGVEKAKAQLQLQQQTYDRQVELFERRVVAQATVDTATRNLDASRQGLAEAEAIAERARSAYGSTIDGVNTTVARLRAELDDALYDLEQTVVRAPGDGFPSQVVVRPGIYVLPNPLRPVMTFVNTGPRDQALGAAFQQNSLQRVKAGDEAEVAFKGVPGRVFKGKVRQVLDAIAAGQLQGSGSLQDFGGPSHAGGRILALIEIVDDISGYNLPGGSAGEVAIYTEHFHHVSLLRKVLLRMRSWQNYVYLEAH